MINNNNNNSSDSNNNNNSGSNVLTALLQKDQSVNEKYPCRYFHWYKQQNIFTPKWNALYSIPWCSYVTLFWPHFYSISSLPATIDELHIRFASWELYANHSSVWFLQLSTLAFMHY
jgi:hypothetical protein